MYFTYTRYIFLVFFLVLGVQAFGQTQNADIQVVQSQPAGKDSLYLDFKIKRTSASPYLLGGYNIVFEIDITKVDTSSYRVVNQGAFGATINYNNATVRHLLPNVYQLTLVRRFPGVGGSVVLDSYQDAGRVAFKISSCGSSVVSLRLASPTSAMATWLAQDVDLTYSPVVPLTVSAKLSPQADITVPIATPCRNASINISTITGYTNYRLYAKSKTGVVSLVAGPQATSPSFVTPISDTTSYFISFTFGSGAQACADSTVTKTVNTAASPVTPIIQGTTDVCTNQTFAYQVANPLPTSTYTWSVASPSNVSTIAGSNTGVGKTQVNVTFNGTTSRTDTIKVIETALSGCSSTVQRWPVRVAVCLLKPDFTINGSDTAISSCQAAKVTFKDASTISGGSTIVKWNWSFGPGAIPDTSTKQNPPTVSYYTPGEGSVKLVITTSAGVKDSITKSPTIKVLTSVTETPTPSCGTSGCNEVNFVWNSISGATAYKVRYKKNAAGAFTAFQNVNLALGFKVTSASPGMGGTLAFNDTRNDTIYFQVRAVAGKCDSTLSSVVFCRPSYCVVGPTCNLPSFSISTPVPGCVGSNVTLKATTNPDKFYNTFPAVRISWDNGKFDTAHSYTVKLTQAPSQNIKFLLIDTTKADCYSLNNITVPVTPILTVKPDLGIQSLECDRVTFVWKHVPGVSKYYIKRTGTCIASDLDWVEAPLGGQAEFYEMSGLTNGCKINFQVKAEGGCNNTQSDTLISPPTCTCYIGHIASSNLSSCALDTALFSVANIQVPNWEVSWTANGVSSPFVKDSLFRFVPPQSGHNGQGGNPAPYPITYTIRDADDPTGCLTSGTILDTTSVAGIATWSPLKTVFCIADVFYRFNDREVSFPQEKNSFRGNGIIQQGKDYYFSAKAAGLGTHSITYNACGALESHDLTVVNTPCVSTVVDAGSLINPNGIYTTCDGVIYLTDGAPNSGNASVYRYDGVTSTSGIPELILRSRASASLDSGSASFVKFGAPAGIVVDENTNNDVYFVDYDKGKVKHLVLDKQKLTTLAGSIQGDEPKASVPVRPLSFARFSGPWGLAINPNADSLYVADRNNRNVKGISFKSPVKTIKLIAGNELATSPLPGLGKKVYLNGAFNIAADSAGLYVTDNELEYKVQQYLFATDSLTYATKLGGRTNNFGYADGAANVYNNRIINGVTPRIGDWIYFTDESNKALRRVNVYSSYVETIAGSFPPIPSDKPTGQNGVPSQTRFTKPGPVSFNIKGYIDILDADNIKPTVRRYYLPNWGVGTWDGFDTSYVVNCDTDTLRPQYALGTLRDVNKPAANVKGNVFAPKDTGTHLLAYRVKIGRCDTVFYKTVRVLPRPKSDLKGDSTCLAVATLTAKLKRDTSYRYKWYGPNNKNLAIAVSDTTRILQVDSSGKYYVDIFFGKNRCLIKDSAIVLLSPASAGHISAPATIPNGIVYADSAKICLGTSVNISMLEDLATQPRFKKFIWSTGETTRTISAIGSANYVATAVDSLGCDIKAVFRVIQQPQTNVCIKVLDENTGKSLPWGTYNVSTIAGSTVAGGTDGIGNNATFNKPWGLFLKNGNTATTDTLWVTDFGGQLVRTINLSNGSVRTFMGSYNNIGIQDSVTKANAKLRNPTGIVVDKTGNVFVANYGDNTIYKYDKSKNLYFNFAGSGSSDFADGVGKNAAFSQPSELRADAAGSLFLADYNNHNIRSISMDRIVTTYAGAKGTGFGTDDGQSTKAKFNWPWGITFDPSGNMIVAEDANHTLRRITMDTMVTKVGGQFTSPGFVNSQYYVATPGQTALLNRPWNLTSDKSGNVFFTDAANGVVRMLDTKGNITTIAGNSAYGPYKDGRYDSSSFQNPAGIIVNPANNDLYVADYNNNVIRKLTKNKIVRVCRGSKFYLSDSCDANATWQKRTLTGGLQTVTKVQLLSGLSDTGTYIVTVKPPLLGTVSCGDLRDSVIIKWYTATKTIAVTMVSPANVYGCKRDTIKITAAGGYSKYIWFKNDSGANLPLDTTLSNNVKLYLDSPDPLVPDFYSVFVKALNPVTGCYDTSAYNPIVLNPRPRPIFSDTFNCVGNMTWFTPLDLDSNAFSGFLYNWDFGDLTTTGDVSTKTITQYRFPQAGTYQVKMVGKTQNTGFGVVCMDSVTRSVIIQPGPISSIKANGIDTDTFRLCGTNSTTLNLHVDVNSVAGGPFRFKWDELLPQDGGSDTTIKGPDNVAKPKTRAGEYSSLFAYTVYAEDGGSCLGPPDTLFAMLSVSPKFSVQASDTTICRGRPITLTPFDSLAPPFVPSDYSYKWDSLGVQVNADTNRAVLNQNPLNTVTYKLTVKNKISLCTTSVLQSVKVSDFRLGLPTIPSVDPCLAPDSLKGYEAKALGSVLAPLQVQWLDSTTGAVPTTLYNPTKLIVSMWRDTVRTYFLKIKDASGCSDSAYVRVPASIRAIPKVKIINGSDTGICVNQSVKVTLEVTNGTPPYNYIWRDAATNAIAPEVDITDPFHPIISAVGNTTNKKYIVEVNDSNRCQPFAKDTVDLTLYNMSIAVSTSQTSGLCRSTSNPNPTADLQVVATDNPIIPSSTHQYQWTHSKTGQIVGTTDKLIGVGVAGMYIAQVVNPFTSCLKRDSVYVAILNSPESITVGIDQASVTCNNKPITLSAKLGAPATASSDSITFTWSLVGGPPFATTTDSVVIYNPTPADTGTIAFAVEAKNRCSSTNGNTPSVTFLQGARAKLEVTPLESFINKEVTFINRSTNTDVTNLLELGDGTSQGFGLGQNQTTTYAYLAKGTYWAKLYAYNVNGCNAIDSVMVTVTDKRDLFVPTVFSPSANNDENRTFRVFGVNLNTEEFMLTVYNRWGQQVYTTNDLTHAMNIGWDGRDSGGDSQMGVYTYIVKGKYNDGQTFQQTGTVTLLR